MSMRLTEPILFPITVYPLEIFKFAGKYSIQNFDVICNYGYQTHHLDIVDRYVDSELKEKFINILGSSPITGYYNTDSFVEEIYQYIDKKRIIYELYYRYFLTSYILESRQYEHNTESLIAWLDIDKDYTFKKCSKYTQKTTIKDYYNTIIIPRLWSKVQLENVTWINKMYGMLPISFNQSKVIKLAGDHLMEGGNMYILRPEDYGRTFWELEDDFDINMDKDPWCFTKKKAPKKTKTTNEINWL